MEEKNPIENTDLEAQSNISTRTKTGMDSKKLEFSKAFKINHMCKPKTNYNFDIKLLSLLALLSIYEENQSELKKNTKYKKFESINIVILHNLEQFEKINNFITNVKIFSENYSIIYYILINDNNNELNIYLSINENELFKYIFKIDDSKAIEANSQENGFLYTIKNHCDNKEIKYYINNPVQNNDTRSKLNCYYLNIIESHKKDGKPSLFLDKSSKNYTSYKGNNSIDIENNNIINSKSFDFDIEKCALENNKKINKLNTEINNIKLELIIFIMKLVIFQENNFNTTSYKVVLEEQKKFPVMYMEVNDLLFNFIFKNPGLSLPEFVEFCDEETSIIIYN